MPTPLENQIIRIIESYENKINIPQHGNGWVNLASLGKTLQDEGIDYNAYGYSKLKAFIESFSSIETYRDDSHTLPVYYVRETNSTSPNSNISHTQANQISTNRSSVMPSLFEWAFLGYIPNTIRMLKDMALKGEDWGERRNENGVDEYPILESYLRYTFYRLMKENEIAQEDQKTILISNNGDYAVFDTGLVNSIYMPIYALFKKNQDRNHPQEWYLVGFCVQEQGRAGRTLSNQFERMPKRARYFQSISDVLYDTTKNKPVLQYDHILSHIDRLPYDFICRIAPRDFEIRMPDSMTVEEKINYFRDLENAIKVNSSSYLDFKNKLDSALDVAIKRVQWNFKSAIPMYYPRRNEMCLLLPLSLVDDDTVDVALVVETTRTGVYRGVTIYKLSWAYKCARLVCRPDSDWLKAGFSTDDDE